MSDGTSSNIVAIVAVIAIIVLIVGVLYFLFVKSDGLDKVTDVNIKTPEVSAPAPANGGG
tara:strand:- start:1210 stop:1389 length:180 start_codon:yes stop_codon:yes gene_type:complete